MSEIFVNKVAESGILTLDLEDFYPKQDFLFFDLKEFLFMGLILKEKDYRESLKNTDWSVYENKIVGIGCTADAIIPMWAYMLAVTYLQQKAKFVAIGNEQIVKENFVAYQIAQINLSDYTDKRVVVKGCGDIQISESAYTAITFRLLPVVKSIMYGEPCSTVPVYKKK